MNSRMERTEEKSVNLKGKTMEISLSEQERVKIGWHGVIEQRLRGLWD